MASQPRQPQMSVAKEKTFAQRSP